MDSIESLKAELAAAKAELEKAKARTWTMWAGTPTKDQSPNVKANLCFALLNNGKPVFEMRGFPVGGHSVVGGIRPWFFVPETEGGFQPFTFNQEKEKVGELAQFPINAMERAALWALKKAEKGELLKKYPVKFAPITQPKRKVKPCDCKNLTKEEADLRTVERGPNGSCCLKCGDKIIPKDGASRDCGDDSLPL